MQGVQQINIVHGIGEEITEITDSRSRMGFVITQGRDPDEAAKIAESALDMIYI